MRTRTIAALALIVFLMVVTILLMNNKTKSEARTKIQSITAIPVTIATVHLEKIGSQLSLVGTIMANNDAAVVSETQGRVTKIFAGIGDYRAAGSPIVKVDDELKHANFITAEVNYQNAKRNLERMQNLHAKSSISTVQLDQAQLACQMADSQLVVARRTYADSTIKSPISGVITARLVDKGSMVQPGAVIANVVDISKMKVRLSVSELDAFRLRINEEVSVTTEVYPGVVYKGRITSISDKADQLHTYPVEISLPNNSKHPLRAGMFGRIAFSGFDDKEAMVIPRESILGSIKSPQVYVVENGTARLREITTGSEIGTNIQVLAGLQAGENVVVTGHNNLKDRFAVSIVR